MRKAWVRRRGAAGSKGASLLELLVSMAVVSVLMVLMVQVLSGALRVWTLGRAKMERYRAGREGMVVLEDRLSHVSMAQRWEYEYEPGAPAIPKAYVAASELRFVCGPAELWLDSQAGRRLTGHTVMYARSGREAGGSEKGGQMRSGAFFVAYGEEPPGGAVGVEKKRRHRLYEVSEPVVWGEGALFGEGWRGRGVERGRMVAENVVLLVVVPMREKVMDNGVLTLGSRFDSAEHGHEVPPQVRLILVGIDEASAERLEAANLLEGLVPGGLFDEWEDAGDLEADLAVLRRRFDGEMGMPVSYQIFDTTVAIPTSRWNS
jgi:uncharacterized protein (TIGR02599 family)